MRSRIVTVAVVTFVLAIFLLAGHKQLKDLLLRNLVEVHPVPTGYQTTQASKNSTNVIYVLGGTQPSLEKRFHVAASLYHSKIANRVLILSRAGITGFSPALRRNLTNDEWAEGKLADLGVNKRDIEPIQVEQGMFGTLAEARGIARLAVARGYKSLILVSSSYHTRRVWRSFSYTLKDQNIELYAYMCNDDAGLVGLFWECLKLLIYESFWT